MENGDIKEIVCSFENLYKAMKKCRKGVMWKDSVVRYSNNGLLSTLNLKDSLMNGTYEISDYCEFIVHEPRKRDIVSPKFKDRVLQRSLCDNYAYDAITKSFIYDNGACQIGKGTDFERDRLKCLMQRHFRKYGTSGYVLNIDFKNFFGSTPHKLAKQAMLRCIDDEWALKHIFEIIDSFNQGEDPEVGLGLGSQVTQLVELAVLNELDHIIKEKFKIRGYVRYADDLTLIHPSKKHLENCLRETERYVEKIGLALNKRKTQLYRLDQGIKFLGFKFKLTETGEVIMTLSKENIKKRKRKIRAHKRLFDEGRMTEEKANECYESWKAHAEKGDSYLLLQKMDKYYENVWEG